MADQPVVLMVGDDPAIVGQARAILEPGGYRVDVMDDALAAMLAVRRVRPAAVLAIGGPASLPWIRSLVGVCRLGTPIPIALVGDELGWVARREGVPKLAKPLDPAEVLTAVAGRGESVVTPVR